MIRISASSALPIGLPHRPAEVLTSTGLLPHRPAEVITSTGLLTIGLPHRPAEVLTSTGLLTAYLTDLLKCSHPQGY